jgi:AraC family transcriptional regulator
VVSFPSKRSQEHETNSAIDGDLLTRARAIESIQADTSMQTSIIDYDPQQVLRSARLLHQRSVLRHLGIDLIYAQLPQSREALSFPAFSEDNLIWHLGGELEIQVKIGRSYRAPVWPGKVFIVPRGQPAVWQFGQACTTMNLFPNGQIMQQLAAELYQLNPNRLELRPQFGLDDPLLFSYGQVLLRLLQEPQADSVALETVAFGLLAQVLRQYTVFQPSAPLYESKLSQPRLGRLIEYIHLHLDTALSLGELGAVVQLSPYHLARMFRSTTGQSLHQYILSQRLLAARHMLLGRHRSLADIALQLGFADQSHLSHHFKRRYGVAPGAFIRQQN